MLNRRCTAICHEREVKKAGLLFLKPLLTSDSKEYYIFTKLCKQKNQRSSRKLKRWFIKIKRMKINKIYLRDPNPPVKEEGDQETKSL